MVKTQHLENIHTAVHAGHNGKTSLGLYIQAVVGKQLHKCAVVLK
jgi:hypothetical protein